MKQKNRSAEILKIFISAPEPDMNEFSFVAEEIAETFMKAKDAHLLMAQDRFQNDAKRVSFFHSP